MANFIRQLALVSESREIDLAAVTRVAAALDKQATRDFAPIWGINSSIHAFERLEDVPLGYWPVIVMDDIHTAGAAGVHQDKNGQPYALVEASDSWSLTASHESLEMLTDPFHCLQKLGLGHPPAFTSAPLRTFSGSRSPSLPTEASSGSTRRYTARSWERRCDKTRCCDEIARRGSFDGVKSHAEPEIHNGPPRDSREQALALIA